MKYQVAGFEIDTAQFDITCDGKTIATEPKVFDLIIYLLENRQRIISRDELFDQIWAGREVSDTSLSNHIKSARKVLGDNGDIQQVIKTIRGRGYQFIAEVVIKPDEEDIPYDQSGKTIAKTTTKNGSAYPKKRSLRYKWLTACLIIFGLIGWQTIERSPVQQINADTRPYILVVPFEVSSNDQAKWQPFADQITREVIRNLRKISGLRVVPASSAFTFKQNKTHAYIREQLPQVRYVLDAMVSIGGQVNIRIAPELEDLFNDVLVWDGDYQGRIDDTNFFTVQAKMAASVSDSLKVVIVEDEQRALGKLPTTNLVAYELYVAGQQQRDLLTHDSLRNSIDMFSQATALDPKFEAAYIAKADAYRIIMSYFDKPIDVLPKVIESVAAALAINPESAEAHSSLGLAYAFAWRWNDAWNMLNKARDGDPNLALTELGFALYYSSLGDIDGINKSLARASMLDPLNVEVADWGHWSLAMAGEVKAAQLWAKNKMQLHPEVGMIYSGASVSASLAGEHLSAVALAQKGALLDPASAYSILALAQAYGYAGQIEKIPPLLIKAEQLESYLCPYETAVAYILLNDINKAFERLNDAVTYRSNCLVFVRNDLRLKSIRNDPRFSALLTRVGLDDESIRKYAR